MKSTLEEMPWDRTGVAESDSAELDRNCRKLMNAHRRISLGRDTLSIRLWSDGTRKDFQRERRNVERQAPNGIYGGFPLIRRDLHSRKKLCGEAKGTFIGLMDDLTPCRIDKDPGSAPWSRLDPAFASINRARLFSSRPDNRGYDHSIAPEKTLTWYAISRTFASSDFSYPMWANQEEIWCPWPRSKKAPAAFLQSVFTFALSENECIETEFPANDPVEGAPKVSLSNPMSLDRGSYWTAVLANHECWRNEESEAVTTALGATKKVYTTWGKKFGQRERIHAEYSKPYFVDRNAQLSKHCGLIQIKHYAAHHKDGELIAVLAELDRAVFLLKAEIYSWLVDKTKLDYFGKGAELAEIEFKVCRAKQEVARKREAKEALRQKKPKNARRKKKPTKAS